MLTGLTAALVAALLVALPQHKVAATMGLLFQPPNCTELSLEQWLSNRGCDPQRGVRIRLKCERVRQLLAEDMGLQYKGEEEEDLEWSCIEGDILLNEEQLDVLEQQLMQRLVSFNNHTKAPFWPTHGRHKRKIYNFYKFPVHRWPVEDGPIVYKIAGSVEKAEFIRSAIKLWEEKTCVRFWEISVSQQFHQPHILFSSVVSYTCMSNVGRENTQIPQPIILGLSCFADPVVIAHEIGHALGLFHEHQRSDRDSFIKVVTSNIMYGAEPYFSTVSDTLQTLGVEYDLASVMHYSSWAFSKKNQPTILTREPLMQRTIGQRVELSFLDYKIINRAYCQKVCKRGPRQRCENGGYQNPNQCERCLCPDGWGGNFCTRVAPHSGPMQCGGVDLKASAGVQEITSPGYNAHNAATGYPSSGQQCSWLIVGALGTNVQLRFTGPFAVRCVVHEACQHWVEVRYNGRLGSPGPRFCCNKTPNVTLTSTGNRVLVIFKALTKVIRVENRRGFRLLYRTETNLCEGSPCQNQGTCHDEFTHIQCVCHGGYSGSRCEQIASLHSITSYSRSSKSIPQPTPTWPMPTTIFPGAVCGHIDVVFAVEVSGGITPSLWLQQFSIIKDYIWRIRMGPEDVLMGVLSIGDQPVTHLLLKDNVDKGSVLASIASIRQRPHQTPDLVRALVSLQQDILNPRYGGRSQARKLAFLFTLCDRLKDTPALREAVDDLAVAGITLSVVCLGSQAPGPGFYQTVTAMGGMFTQGDGQSASVAPVDKMLQQTCVPEMQPTRQWLAQMDLVFALDTSAAVDTQLWYYMVDFMERTVAQFELSTSAMQVGMMTFGQGAEFQLSLHQFTTKENFINTLHNIELPTSGRHGANVYHALWQLRTDIFQGKGTRRSAKNVVILLLASKSTVGIKMVAAEAKNIRKAGIKLVGLGLGSHVQEQELQAIVQNPNRVHILRHSADISSYASKIAHTISEIGGAQDPNVRSSWPGHKAQKQTFTQDMPVRNSVAEASTTIRPTPELSRLSTSRAPRSTTGSTTTQSATLPTSPSTITKVPPAPPGGLELCSTYIAYYDRRCSHPCGGCGTLRRWRVCRIRSLWRIETCELESCNTQRCTAKDRCPFSENARVFFNRCQVPCCHGYVSDDAGHYCRQVAPQSTCPHCCTGYKPVWSTMGKIVCVHKSRRITTVEECVRHA